jgi:signal transduction histidine kinase/PAS domain-containing protein
MGQAPFLLTGQSAANIIYTWICSAYRIRPTKKQAVKPMQNTETLSHDTILDNIPGGVAVFCEDSGKISLKYANAGFYKLHHGSREYWAAVSEDPVGWLIPEDRSIFWNEFNKVSGNLKKQGSAVYRVTGEDGCTHWVSNQFCPACLQDGKQYYYASFTDMDKLIAARQELLRDRQMYEDATMSSKLIIWSYDIATHRAEMMRSGYTDSVCRRLNVPPVIDDVVNTFLPFINPDDREAFKSTYLMMENGASRAECEFRFQLPAQDSEQVELMTLRRINDSDGRLLTIYCSAQNITEQRQREEDYEQVYRQLEKAYPDSLGSFHLNLTRNWCGNGKSPLSFVLKQGESGTADGYFIEFSKLIADDDIRSDFLRRFRRELLLKQFAAGVSDVSIEYPIIYADGVRHWRNGLMFMLKNPQTGDVEAVTYAVDIDERKKSEFIMEKLIHDHFDYIGIIHPVTRMFEFRSRRSWITYGRIGEQLPYDECCKYISRRFSNSAEKAYFSKITALESIVHDLAADETHTVSYLNTVGGVTTCTALQYSWLEQPGGDILVVRSDITDAYRKEQDQIRSLEREKRAAEAANIAKSEFLSRMSHDIRTPLNGIIDMTYIARGQDNPPETKKCLTNIDTSSKFLLSLINDVLDMSKAESGRIELHPEPYPIAEFKEYLNAIILPLCRDRSQTFSIECRDSDNDTIPVLDKLRINQVIFNLLSNAVKYTHERGTIKCIISEERLSDEQLHLHIEISDNGIGMSDKFQKQLFDPFTQENRPECAEMRGSGLGLAITRQMVDAMGGHISVHSRLNEGSTFLVDLRCGYTAASQMNISHKLTSGSQNIADLRGRHILLCEDHPLNQEIAKTILNEKGMLVEIAGDGQAGVKAFSNSTIGYFDCILMDIHMPIMNGYETSMAIRALNRADAASVPIIAMTADAYDEDVRKCLEAGMTDHIAKPVDPARLFGVLCSHICPG